MYIYTLLPQTGIAPEGKEVGLRNEGYMAIITHAVLCRYCNLVMICPNFNGSKMRVGVFSRVGILSRAYGIYLCMCNYL